MSKKTPPPDVISKALDLDGSPEAIRDYYANWAKSYDSDVGGDHVAPLHMTNVLVDWIAKNRPDARVAEYQVMDVGCGTGMVGTELVRQGFKIIDGVDLSAEMIEQCADLKIYRQLTADIDINLDSHSQWAGKYDVVTCCGVFTLGHVHPESLLNMLRFAQPGGLVITTTRDAYYESTDYQRVSDRAVSEGRAQLLLHLENAPYTNDSDAHYWLYQVT
ncbi:MAG: class I SAM-dependent methyltransferase [Gammaproteobacteria bacterium]|nr:class I SAM-dependent methyltransferase [Gammaproteobacteria bacterium]